MKGLSSSPGWSHHWQIEEQLSELAVTPQRINTIYNKAQLNLVTNTNQDLVREEQCGGAFFPSLPYLVLTWKLQPFGHLSWIRPGRFSSLALCRRVLLILCSFATSYWWLWRKQWRFGGQKARRGCWGLEHAAEMGEERWENKTLFRVT